MRESASPAPLDRRFLLGGLAGAAGVSALAAMARGAGGPINPPSGAVTSTGKTLTDVEPRIALSSTNTPGDADSVYKITQAGGYYLTGNMLVPTGKHAIKIAASGVTVDLNGFLIAGFGGLGGIIPSSTAIERITIRNGSIVSLPFGIQFTDVPDVTVENVRIENVTGYGIRTGDRGIARHCTVVNAGVYGIRAEDGSVVEGCTVSGCTGVGISTHFGSRVSGCSAVDNTNQGIIAYGLVTACIARGNDGGIQVQDGAVVSCVASNNQASGIYGSGETAIIDCTAEGNVAGIGVEERCLVRGCFCTSNQLSGIGVSFFGNRIEGNTCTENDRGIRVSDTDNVITGNFCMQNRVLNYDIVAGNVALVVAAATAGAISGNTGGVSPGTTNPWANLAV